MIPTTPPGEANTAAAPAKKASQLGELSDEVLKGFGFEQRPEWPAGWVKIFAEGHVIQLIEHERTGYLVELWNLMAHGKAAITLPAPAFYARDLSKVLSLYDEIAY